MYGLPASIVVASAKLSVIVPSPSRSEVELLSSLIVKSASGEAAIWSAVSENGRVSVFHSPSA